MRLSEIHRYAVKSTGGELLPEAVVDDRGLAGDRLWAVADRDGRLATGKDSRRFRRMDPVFELAARLGDVAGREVPGGEVPEVRWPDGRWERVDAEGADDRLAAQMGEPARFVREGSVGHQDGGQVSLVGTASLAALAALVGEGEPVDVRHFRTNLVVQTDQPWVEETWVGQLVRVGEVVLRVVERVERCRTVDLAQDGADAHGRLLRTLGAERDVCLAVYADVVTPGTLRVGDVVRV